MAAWTAVSAPVRIVLVRPRDPNNIGAAARAMANFGLADLVVVAPYAPVWREAKSAVGADAVLGAAREAATLDEAIGDCTLVGATTAGQRRRLARLATPAEFSAEVTALAPGARAALVFGNEKSGLARDEIARCHVAVRIPTSAAQPSMNLAHAVAVACYALAVAAPPAAPPARSPRLERPVTLAEIDALVAAAFPPADEPGREARRAASRERLRALLVRARATAPDVALLRGLAEAAASDTPTRRSRTKV